MTQTDLLEKLDFKKGGGLIPVIVQDAKTKEILMQAYANRQAVELTLKTKKPPIGAVAETKSGLKAKPAGTPKKSSLLAQTVTTTHCSTWLNRLDQRATQGNTAAFSTSFCS